MIRCDFGMSDGRPSHCVAQMWRCGRGPGAAAPPSLHESSPQDDAVFGDRSFSTLGVERAEASAALRGPHNLATEVACHSSQFPVRADEGRVNLAAVQVNRGDERAGPYERL